QGHAAGVVEGRIQRHPHLRAGAGAVRARGRWSGRDRVARGHLRGPAGPPRAVGLEPRLPPGDGRALSERDANVELVRETFEIFERRDIEGVFAIAADDVEVGAAAELPNSGTYHGHDGFLRWIAQWLDAWDEFRIELLEVDAI